MDFFVKAFSITSKEESRDAAHWGLTISWQIKVGVVEYSTSGYLGAGFV